MDGWLLSYEEEGHRRVPLFTGSVTPMEPKSLLIDRTKLQLDVVTRATDIEYCNRLRWKCNEER